MDLLTKKIERGERKLLESDFCREWKRSLKGKTLNVYSDPQLRYFLYKVKKLSPFKTTTSGAGSTDEEALKHLNIPELNELLSIGKLKTMRDTYLKGFLREEVNGYIHPSFNLNLVRTFRSSCQNPNLQNVPSRDEYAMKLTRQALYPRPGHQLLEIDYKGVEVSVSCAYHNDSTMIKYMNDSASDMHADMASQLFLIDPYDKNIPELKYLRSATKNGFVFPQFYGSYYKNCAQNLSYQWGELPVGKWKKGQGVDLFDGTLGDHLIDKGFNSLDKFTDHVQEIEKGFWENRFPEYAAWKERWWKTYQKYGYFNTLTGFTCSGVMGHDDVTNYPIQGSAFHCLLWAFNETDRIMRKDKWDTRLLGQVHDSMLLDVNPQEKDMVMATVKRITCEDLPKAWSWINVPLDVDAEICEVDRPWSEKNKVDFF
jgi:DNA polymerase-1